MKKRAVALVLLALFCVTCLPASASASGADQLQTTVYMTVSDGEGNIPVAVEAIMVYDCDLDGLLTVHDAMVSLHRQKHPDGEEVFLAARTEWDFCVTRFWGNESGNFGYYVNGGKPTGLGQEIKYGDYIYGFVYTDAVHFSDAYARFDCNRIKLNAGDRLTLTLTYISGYDEQLRPVYTPLAGAILTVNGVPVDKQTDEKGIVTLRLQDVGTAVISAFSDDVTLISPICVATVNALQAAPQSPTDGAPLKKDNRGLILGVTLGTALLVVAGVYIYWIIKKR